MNEDGTRLNIERAREALARARMDQITAAVRAPRPADLSRLQEEQARRIKIDSRAGAFREAVRDSLGLGEYRGSGAPVTASIAHAMSAPLCDADICTPVSAAAAEPGPVADSDPADALDMDAETPLPAETETVAALPDLDEAPAPVRAKRRKFLGLF